jgi:hypothetical protein
MNNKGFRYCGALFVSSRLTITVVKQQINHHEQKSAVPEVYYL